MAMNEVIAYIRPDDGEVFKKQKDGRFRIERFAIQFPDSHQLGWGEETLKNAGFTPITQESLKLIRRRNAR